ncbi:hypothetical protein CIHG_03448 [Coccidioides immitis H538.4]|uniref:Uncharacterized protein n=2 Tax=Coccidioides immitis TaxID=5501 RepID=A0A0J8RPJ9_COCIT|nr:hypothetical protein CIRG_08798 [Coccidioides immitis RMSCC 2394]KMU85919.1 hypothetical protein CIHG_03448 [Coccidioides immitis H538.4]
MEDGEFTSWKAVHFRQNRARDGKEDPPAPQAAGPGAVAPAPESNRVTPISTLWLLEQASQLAHRLSLGKQTPVLGTPFLACKLKSPEGVKTSPQRSFRILECSRSGRGEKALRTVDPQRVNLNGQLVSHEAEFHDVKRTSAPLVGNRARTTAHLEHQDSRLNDVTTCEELVDRVSRRSLSSAILKRSPVV